MGLGRPGYAESRDEQLEDEQRCDVGESSEGEDKHRVEREVVRHEPGEKGSAGGSGGSAKADHGAYAG